MIGLGWGRLGRIEPYYYYVAKLLYMAKRVKPEMLGAVSVPGYKGVEIV